MLGINAALGNMH